MLSIPGAQALAVRFQPYAAESATALLHGSWGIVPTSLKKVTTERDDTFLVTVGPDRCTPPAYVLKIDNPVEDPGVTDFQVAVLEHLAVTDPSLPVQRVVRTRDGSTTATGDERRRARLLTYLHGETVHAAGALPARTLVDIGDAQGRLVAALADLRHPAEDRPDLLWESKSLARLRPIVDAYVEPGLRNELHQFVDRAETAVLPRLLPLRKQVVHNDFNLTNVLVSPVGLAGILDFGDVVRTELASDLAVTLTYFVLRAAGPAARSGSGPGDVDLVTELVPLLVGYLRHQKVTTDEVDLLAELVMVRLAITILVPLWTAAQHPERREYLERFRTEVTTSFRYLRSLVPGTLERQICNAVDRASASAAAKP